MSKAILITLVVAILASYAYADFASDCLNAHNVYRAALNITNLTWSTTIAASAQAWANQLATQRYLAHGSADYGENLASRTGQYVNDDGTISSVDRKPSTSSTSSSSSSTSSQSVSSTNSNTTASTTSASSTNSTENSRNLGGDNNSQKDNDQDTPNERSGNFPPLINRRSDDGGDGDEDNSDQNNRLLEELIEEVEFEEFNGSFEERVLANTKGTALVNALIGQWGYEQKYFVYGVFPNVSTGGTIGHFTQMIWRRTTKVGCGIANNDGGWVYFVCQYDPSGNWRGELVY